MKRKVYLVIFLGFSLFIYACKKEALIKEAVSSFLGFQQPANFPVPIYKLENNKITEDGFILGRTLFYENSLSRNNTISCSSCHVQSVAFTQPGHNVGHGIDDRSGTRNPQPIMNLAWNKTFFWDGNISDLDLQSINPITNPVEMDEKMENVISKLKRMPRYISLFKKAYGTDEINDVRLMKALSQFMVMCTSTNSKYDRVMRKEENQSFTSEELAGYGVFKENCRSCHTEPLFADESFRNNGLLPGLNNDLGRFTVTLNPTDKYKFKVPSLRNLSFTPPYMHDGRFLTINEVLAHYTSGVQPTPNLDPILRINRKLGIELSDVQKLNLIAFLKTLDDHDFITRKDLSGQ